MFNNLKNELKSKNISLISYSKILGVSEKTVQNKLNGLSEFTLSEIKTTLDIFPQYKIDYLFATDEKSA